MSAAEHSDLFDVHGWTGCVPPSAPGEHGSCRCGGGGLLLGEQVGVGVGCERHGAVTEHGLRDASCSRLTRRSETVRRMRIAYVGTLMGEARAGWETLGP